MVSSIRPHVTPVPTEWLGAGAWLAALLAIDAPLQERILLLAPPEPGRFGLRDLRCLDRLGGTAGRTGS